jgi:hypothetical protein
MQFYEPLAHPYLTAHLPGFLLHNRECRPMRALKNSEPFQHQTPMIQCPMGLKIGTPNIGPCTISAYCSRHNNGHQHVLAKDSIMTVSSQGCVFKYASRRLRHAIADRKVITFFLPGRESKYPSIEPEEISDIAPPCRGPSRLPTCCQDRRSRSHDACFDTKPWAKGGLSRL